jgi:REP element-mobilizing transposase RayT
VVSQILHKLFTVCVKHRSYLQYLTLNIYIVLNTFTRNTITCREYRSYLIKYFVNCSETEGIIIYNHCILLDILHLAGIRQEHYLIRSIRFVKMVY